MNKIKIRKLILQGFRGARKKVPVDFSENTLNFVLFGNNGDGKSTFSDAIEWYFTDKIDYLQREGCGRDDYFNKYMPVDEDATVEINFCNNSLDSQKVLKRKGGATFSNTNTDFFNYIQNSSKESFILRHHTMRDFVDKTKKEKLEKVEEIIGFNIIKDVRDVLLRSLNALRDDRQLVTLQGQLNEKRRDLENLVGKTEFQDYDIVECANQIARQCDPSVSISNILDFKDIVETFDKKVKASDKGQELSRLEHIDESVTKLQVVKEIDQKIKNIIESHNELAKQQEMIKASVLDKLYNAAIEAIENKWVKVGECPLCKKSTDTELLSKSLKEELEQIKKILIERNQVIQTARSLNYDVGSLQTILRYLQQPQEKTLFESSGREELLSNLSASLLMVRDILNTIQQTPQAVSSISLLNNPEKIAKELEEIRQDITKKKQKMNETEEEKIFYQNIHKFKKLCEDYTRYGEIIKLIDIYNKQIVSLEKVYQNFEDLERESIKRVLHTISADVNEFFTFLHPDDNFDEVELIPTEERGIEFKLKYHGEEISPPMKILSEAHLNSLGICLFLASAKHFNKINGFLILDDVITSFDIGHRRPLARLLSEKFSDMQFFLFTHDKLWFDMLKKDLLFGKWFFKELMKWSKDNGLDLKDSPLTLRERIKDYLDVNDIGTAANKCRILIEGILKEKCEDLGVKELEFRIGSKNDQRDASELIDALISHINKNQTLRDKQSKNLFSHLKASQLITNIGSHHRNLKSTSLSRGDIETVLRDIDEFESLFVCLRCGKQASIKYSARNSELKQCECGELRI